MLVNCMYRKARGCKNQIEVPDLLKGIPIACRVCTEKAAASSLSILPAKPTLSPSERAVVDFIKREEERAARGEKSPIIKKTDEGGFIFVRLLATLREAIESEEIACSMSAAAVIRSLAEKRVLIRVRASQASSAFRWGYYPDD